VSYASPADTCLSIALTVILLHQETFVKIVEEELAQDQLKIVNTSTLVIINYLVVGNDVDVLALEEARVNKHADASIERGGGLKATKVCLNAASN
jgi:hypothetical protein